MTEHTDEFSQFAEPMTCREYIWPRDEKSTDPKGWIQGNTKIGPVSEVTTSYLQGKYGLEIRMESVKQDSSHSWVRISDDNEQETSETKTDIFALKTQVFVSEELHLFVKECGLILNQELNPIKRTQWQKD